MAAHTVPASTAIIAAAIIRLISIDLRHEDLI